MASGTAFALIVLAMGSLADKAASSMGDGIDEGGAERRRFSRVKLISPLYGHLLTGDLSFTVREASIGGFSIESPEPFAVNTKHTFRFEIPSGHTATVLAVCRYCTEVHRAGEPASHVSGFEFLPQPTENLRLVIGAIAADAP